jgi:hypothetical protein
MFLPAPSRQVDERAKEAYLFLFGQEVLAEAILSGTFRIVPKIALFATAAVRSAQIIGCCVHQLILPESDYLPPWNEAIDCHRMAALAFRASWFHITECMGFPLEYKKGR